MMKWSLGLVAVLVPIQFGFGHLAGDIVHRFQPVKFAAIEGRWKTQQPASEVIIGFPDAATERNLYALEIPKLGSFIASGNWNSREIGIDSVRPIDRPPVAVPFFTFRLMVGMGLVMLAISWVGLVLSATRRLEGAVWFNRLAVLAFPSGFVAVLAGWFTAEVGRQPWIVYGLLRTQEAVTPSLAVATVAFSLIAYVIVYCVVYSFGFVYVFRLIRRGPVAGAAAAIGITPSRPLALAADPAGEQP